MTSFILRAFLTLFVVLDPIGLVPIFITLAGEYPPKVQIRIIRQAILVAGGILFIFALFGNQVLRYLGISIEAFQVAAGVRRDGNLSVTPVVFARPLPHKVAIASINCIANEK